MSVLCIWQPTRPARCDLTMAMLYSALFPDRKPDSFITMPLHGKEQLKVSPDKLKLTNTLTKLSVGRHFSTGIQLFLHADAK